MSRARNKKVEMTGNFLGALPSGGLAGAERSEGERSEPQRSGAVAKAGADSVSGLRPDPEVVAKPKRRTYTAEYKQRILEEAELTAVTRGGTGRPSPPRRPVLIAADLLAARAGQWNPRGSDSSETRAQVPAQPDGRGSSKTSSPQCTLDRRST